MASGTSPGSISLPPTLPREQASTTELLDPFAAAARDAVRGTNTVPQTGPQQPAAPSESSDRPGPTNVARGGVTDGPPGIPASEDSPAVRGRPATLTDANRPAPRGITGDVAGGSYGAATRAGLGPAAASPANVEYANLLARGRALSRNVTTGRVPPTAATEVPRDPRSIKDPVEKFGLGSTPSRPMYGPSGASSSYNSPATNAVDPTAPRGSGSYISPGNLPQLPRMNHAPFRNAPRESQSRTYDPARGY